MAARTQHPAAGSCYDEDDLEHFKFVIQQVLLSPDIVQMLNVERSILLDELITLDVITQYEKEHIEVRTKQQDASNKRRKMVLFLYINYK